MIRKIYFARILGFVMTVVALAAALPCSARSQQKVLPPFVIMVGADDALPKVTDEDIWQNGEVVSFSVDDATINTKDPGYIAIVKALKNLPKGYHFCRLLVMRGGASPEGPVANNISLSQRRAHSLADSLRRYITLPDSDVEVRYVSEDYKGLRHLIAASKMRYREEILTIIDVNKDEAVIKRKLKTLDAGKAWQELLHNFFPQLRATRVLMLVSKTPKNVKETEVVQSSSDIMPSTDIVEEDTAEEKPFKPWIALKTNVLYDVAATPNLEIERWFGGNNQWSVMAETAFPWWQWHNKSRVYEVIEGGLELRRWLHSSHRSGEKHRPLTGHFLGLYAAGGYYDLEWDYKGEQGDFYSGGLSYGYACKLSKHWNMEFSLAVGYLYSPYTHYEAENHNDDLYARYKKNFSYFGPTKLKVSFVWLIP